MSKQEIHEWIIENLDLANEGAAKGFIPINCQNNEMTFQKINYPVEYCFGKFANVLIRIDYIGKVLDIKDQSSLR